MPKDILSDELAAGVRARTTTATLSRNGQNNVNGGSHKEASPQKGAQSLTDQPQPSCATYTKGSVPLKPQKTLLLE